MNYNNICDILICEKELFIIGRMIFRMIKNFEICFRETIDIANIEYVFSIDELITEWHFDLWKRIIYHWSNDFSKILKI